MTKSDAGRLGGLATFDKYGSEEMRSRGALGGRPRNKTLSEIQRQKALDADNKIREVMGDKIMISIIWVILVIVISIHIGMALGIACADKYTIGIKKIGKIIEAPCCWRDHQTVQTGGISYY